MLYIYDFVDDYRNFPDLQCGGEAIEDIDIYESLKEQIKNIKQSDIAKPETLLERPKNRKLK
jgi:hypothetical protein